MGKASIRLQAKPSWHTIPLQPAGTLDEPAGSHRIFTQEIYQLFPVAKYQEFLGLTFSKNFQEANPCLKVLVPLAAKAVKNF